MTQTADTRESPVPALEGQPLFGLLALRVLAAHEGGGGHWIPLPALLSRAEEERARWTGEAGQAADGRNAGIHPSRSVDTVRALATEGLVEVGRSARAVARAERGDGAGATTYVRLAAGLRAMEDLRARLEALLESRLAPVPEPPPEPMPDPAPEHGAPGPESPRETAASVVGIAVASVGSTLAAQGLVKVYRKRRVVNEVDIHVSQGEIVGLLGPNGAGKTTTFYMMVGLIAPDRGRVRIGGEDVTAVPMYRRARKGIGYLSQEPSVFRKLTVEENVLAILQMIGLSRREQRERLEELLDELGIKHLRKAKAYSLSGGERRRLEITRALVGRPKFMLLDEPFAGVDPIAVHDIQQIVADLRRRSIGVLISDHNVEQTLDIVDRAYIMYDGRVRVSGTVSELVWNDEVAEIYLGPTLTARMRQRYTYPE
jgi:lipopolysaccharide export system ATP-binding protein